MYISQNKLAISISCVTPYANSPNLQNTDIIWVVVATARTDKINSDDSSFNVFFANVIIQTVRP